MPDLNPPPISPHGSLNNMKNHLYSDLESPIDSGLRERKKFEKFPTDEQADFEVVVEEKDYQTGSQHFYYFIPYT